MTLASNCFDYGALPPPQAMELRTTAENILSRSATITAAIIECVALRLKLRAGIVSSTDQCRSAAAVTPASAHVDLEHDPHDPNLYRPKVLDGDDGGIPAFLDRRTWASG